MRVLICGSRDWTDKEVIERVVSSLPEGAVVISGMARGADTIAAEAAIRRGLETLCFWADWKTHGKRAGYLRNKQMLQEGKPDKVVAFQIGNSRSTQMMIGLAQEAGVPVEIYQG